MSVILYGNVLAWQKQAWENIKLVWLSSMRDCVSVFVCVSLMKVMDG